MAMTTTGSAPDLSSVASGTAPLDQELAVPPAVVIIKHCLGRFNAKTDALKIGDDAAATPDRAHLVGNFGKAFMDRGAAAILLLLLAPLFLVVVLLIRRDGGMALFRHKRLGARGRVFPCLKFRTMVSEADKVLAHLLVNDPAAAAEWHATQKLRHDPRITRVGQFLRKTSLDELPQLINVLRGEMSLVGPRPIVRAEVARYGREIHQYYRARPGLTGLWQISGRSNTSYDQRVQLDVRYVANWTLWRDVVIIAKTIPAVLLRKGAV